MTYTNSSAVTNYVQCSTSVRTCFQRRALADADTSSCAKIGHRDANPAWPSNILLTFSFVDNIFRFGRVV